MKKKLHFLVPQKNNLCTLQWLRTMAFFLSASHSFITKRAGQTICFHVILQRIQPAEIPDKFVLLCCYDESLCIFLLHWLISLCSLGLVCALRDKLDSDLYITMLQPMLRMNLQLNPLTSSGSVLYARLAFMPYHWVGKTNANGSSLTRIPKIYLRKWIKYLLFDIYSEKVEIIVIKPKPMCCEKNKK